MATRTKAWVEPNVGLAGEWGTWVVHVRVGETGISTGGGLRVQLPDSWHAWYRNSAKRVQATDPYSPQFVAARCTSEGVALRCEIEDEPAEEYVKTNRGGLDGRSHRYVFVTRITVEAGRLLPGEEVRVIYGDKSRGGAGFSAALHPEGPEAVLVAVDGAGTGEFVRCEDDGVATLEVLAGDPAELVVTAPSVAAVGESISLHLALLDRLGNRVACSDCAVALEVATGSAELPTTVTIKASEHGTCRVQIRGIEPGVLRVKAHAMGLEALGNPTRLTIEPPKLRLYWGDLHSHAQRSFDAVGTTPFAYARHVAALDFYALTDHAEGWPPNTWAILRKAVREANEAEQFVAILGYEATFGEPWGHHNVYFRDEDGVVLGADKGTLLELWSRLEAGQAITIPHHTGVCFAPSVSGIVPGAPSGRCPSPDWNYHDARFRRLVEIYSGHGLCETYDPGHPLAYEHCDFSINTSRQGPYYVHDAWLRGHQLGVIASSDNHRGQPGRGETGLAGVWAPSLTRESIFNALLNRQTLATTGARVLVDLEVDGCPAGTVRVGTGPAHISAAVNGSDLLDKVELIAVDLEAGQTATLMEWNFEKEYDAEIGWEDPVPPATGLYYLRVRQQKPYRARPVMAWSSPVWLAPGPITPGP